VNVVGINVATVGIGVVSVLVAIEVVIAGKYRIVSAAVISSNVINDVGDIAVDIINFTVDMVYVGVNIAVGILVSIVIGPLKRERVVVVASGIVT
jgi:hypothetical protein